MSLEPCHCLIQVLLLLGNFGHNRAAVLHQREDVSEIAIENLLAFDPLADIWRLQVQHVQFESVQQPVQQDGFLFLESRLENLLLRFVVVIAHFLDARNGYQSADVSLQLFTTVGHL